MAMELLDGSDMKHAIARRAPLSLDEKLSVVDQIRRAWPSPTRTTSSTATSSPRTSTSSATGR